MKVVFDEIVKTHPAGKTPGAFRRMSREEVAEVDLPTFVPQVGSIAWFTNPARKMMVVLATRLIVSSYDDGVNRVCVLVDVCSKEFYDSVPELKALSFCSFSSETESRYIAWATENKVWP